MDSEQEAKALREQALAIAQVLEDGKGEAVTVIDVTGLTSWTDYFVIATIHSAAHWQGLAKQVLDYAKAHDLQVHQTHNKLPDGDEWNLLDLGAVVVHLMSADARSFYELEKLWHSGKVLR